MDNYAPVSVKTGFFSGVVVRPRPGVMERLGNKKVFVIHDGIEESELDRLCMEIGGRNNFKFSENTKHTPVKAFVGRKCVEEKAMRGLLSEETITQWVQFRPDITVLVLGQKEIVDLKLFRCSVVYIQWTQGDIKELVERGREFAEDKQEYDLRMKEGHWFLFATPKCLMEDVEGMTASMYQDIKLKHTAMMIQKRKEFHANRIITFKVGEDLIVDMGRAISKLLCFRCNAELDTFGTPVRCFEMGGCDDPSGESLLRAIRERESS